jgi:Mn-dependent DtxR family transcriptional regulator
MSPLFTRKQGQYLAFIYYYTKINGRPSAEVDMQRYFQTSPLAVHQMILKLELLGFISREPGKARSVRVVLPPEALPALE